MKWTGFLGSCLLVASAACGPTLDVGNDGTDAGTPANGAAVCDEYATYCEIPAGEQKVPYCSRLEGNRCSDCVGHGVSGGCPAGKTCYNDECQ